MRKRACVKVCVALSRPNNFVILSCNRFASLCTNMMAILLKHNNNDFALEILQLYKVRLREYGKLEAFIFILISRYSQSVYVLIVNERMSHNRR